MSIEAAIYLLILILVIVAVAWVLVYLAGQMDAPPPVRVIIWAVAFLLVLLVVLQRVGVLHAAEPVPAATVAPLEKAPAAAL